MNTHAVQKNKGESGGDTRCDVLVCVTFFCCKHLHAACPRGGVKSG